MSEKLKRLWARLSEPEEYANLCSIRELHLVPVREPLVVVSQVARSGGTLLSQLFDGHPECHAHPHELLIGWPNSRCWPPIDMSTPEEWFDMLYEKRVKKHFVKGYKKPAGITADGTGIDVYPFAFFPRLQKRLFEHCVAEWPMETRRDVLDAYWTSYFNAWLDNHNLYTGPKRVVTGFAPELNMREGSVDGFFADYPTGSLITIIRDPRAWYASARNQKKGYEDVDKAMGKWCSSAEAAIEFSARYGDRVLVLSYEELVQDTEATMRRVADHIGITFDDILLEPTFNRRPIRANSSAAVQQYGVIPTRTEAFRKTLDPELIERVEELAGNLYERARELTPARV